MSNLFLILCSSVVNEIFWQPQCWMRISHVNTLQQQPGEETVCPTELEIKDLHGLARSRELNRLRLLYFKVVLSFSLKEGNMCQQQQQSLMPLQIWQYNIVSLVLFQHQSKTCQWFAITDFECFCSRQSHAVGVDRTQCRKEAEISVADTDLIPLCLCKMLF